MIKYYILIQWRGADGDDDDDNENENGGVELDIGIMRATQSYEDLVKGHVV